MVKTLKSKKKKISEKEKEFLNLYSRLIDSKSFEEAIGLLEIYKFYLFKKYSPKSK